MGDPYSDVGDVDERLSLGGVFGDLVLLCDPCSGVLGGGLDQTETSGQLAFCWRSAGNGSRAGKDGEDGAGETHDE